MSANRRCDIERDERREARRRAKGRLVKERITKEDGRYLIYYTFKCSDEDSDSTGSPAATAGTDTDAGAMAAGPAQGRRAGRV
ncbi:MAG: hypothetical protein ACM3X3_00535 [Betaproteobacteria bacterium]